MERRVLVVYTGGTIGMIKNKNGALAPVPHVLPEQIRKISQMHDSVYRTSSSYYPQQPLVLPAQSGEVRVLYWIREFSPLLDSSNMGVDDWLRIASLIEENYNDYDGFVVLHGTDTLAYTASALSFLFRNLRKTIIVTGSQVPIFEMSNDGLNNFLSSVTIAGLHMIPEVAVFFGDKLLRGNRTVKFCSVNCEGAFISPNCESLATYDVNLHVNSQQIFRPNQFEKFSMHSKLSRNVVLLKIFPGIRTAMIEEFLKPPVEGVVLQTFGAGNIPDRNSDITDVLSAATARGVVIVNCTQCTRGSVCAIYATNQALVDAGVISGHDMTVEAAFTKLSMVLANDEWNLQTKRHIMKRNLRGELTAPEKTLKYDVNYNTVIRSCLKMSFENELQQIRSVFFPAAMSQAAAGGNVEQCLQLERKGGDFFTTNADGRTPLHTASSEGHLDIVDLALSRGASVHIKDRFGRTPLDDAISGRHFDVVRRLASCGAELQTEVTGEEVCKAAARGDINLLNAYRIAGASLNEQDCTGRAPIHMATFKCQGACCEYLLACGVDAGVADDLGYTPLDYARIKNFSSILALLADQF